MIDLVVGYGCGAVVVAVLFWFACKRKEKASK